MGFLPSFGVAIPPAPGRLPGTFRHLLFGQIIQVNLDIIRQQISAWRKRGGSQLEHLSGSVE